MKTKSLFTSLILFFFIFTATSLSAQTTTSKYVYELNFPQYDMQDIKPLVSLTQGLFDTNIEIQDDNYTKFIYRSNNVVTEEQVKAALEGSKFQLISLTVVKK
jgi:hypothetical protein